MPRDEFGNIADIAMDVKSTPARLNGGRLYDTYIKASMLKVERLVKEKMKEYNYEDPHNIPDEIIKQIFTIPMGFVKLLKNNLYNIYHGVYTGNDYEAMRAVIITIVEDNFRIHLEVGEEKKTYLLVIDIYNSIYKPDKSKVTYVNNGEVVVSDSPILISPMYFILLSKIADTLLTTSSAAVNHHGLPVVVNKNDKHNMPHKNNPVRALGETEKRILVNEGGRELAAELSDINASILSHRIVYESIITADKPTNIDRVIDRKKHPFGTERALEILNTLDKTVGDSIVHIKDKDRYINDIEDEFDDEFMLDLGTDENIDDE